MDRDEISNLYRGPSIDASYQVSVHLAEVFQRKRLKCEKLTDDRRRTPSDGKSSHCLWQGELKTQPHPEKLNYWSLMIIRVQFGFIITAVSEKNYKSFDGAVVVVWQFDLQLPVQSVLITTKVVSLNLVHGEVYSIQHYHM